ncbi:MAG: type II toxin-antitoxin system Phd/YefM family antitoxin [Acidobacteria bacterium]|nr:type II toxin-antitoxin system Phd/YefM family antitoxin [Acidobacteriota bacterium]MBI3656552.1 type II toxin-antitoxin system Phd/YefM family antitoxin [Acidobacteriota bacterium]
MKAKSMVHHLPLTQARHRLGEVIKRVHLNKECIILEKDGIPVAGLINIDELEDYLELQDPKVRKIIKEGYEEYRAGKARPWDEVLAEVKKKAKHRKRK